MKFFETSTRNLRAYEEAASLRHHVALSVVGSERLLESGYFRAKIAQENLIKDSSIPHSIVRATQFFEFVKGIADFSPDGNNVRLPPALIQPMAADDVASAVGRIAMGSPVNGTVEVGGPEKFRLDELVRRGLAARNDESQRSSHTTKEAAMSTKAVRTNDPTSDVGVARVDMKFEIVVIPVSDVDRAKEFYGRLGWRLDADYDSGKDFRVIQFTPPGSGCSVIFGKNVTAAAPGSAQGLYLIVSDVEAAREELVLHGVDVSEV